MIDPIPSDEDYIRQITPDVSKTLASEFANLSEQARQLVQRQTLLACLNIHRKAKKQRLNQSLFVRQVVREQVLVWSATYGSPSEQATAMNQIMLQNRGAVARYLNPKQFRFRTTAVVDEVINDAFEGFFTNLSRQKPVESFISTSVISIARYKALRQLRDDRTGSAEKWDWLETTFVTVNNEAIGSLEWPVGCSEEEETILSFNLPASDAAKTIPVQIDLSQLQRWIADCFEKLPVKRRFLVRLRYRFWTKQDLKSLSIDEIQTLFDDGNMADIAQKSGYANAHTASVRLKESLNQLRDCLTEKMTNPAL